jgi:DNA-binding transcriptional MerR regulator
MAEKPSGGPALYPISTVADRTGLSVPTLRQWENRYGFPDPERTEGGHRRYTETDIQALLTVCCWVEDGASPSAAIDRLSEVADEGEADRRRLAGELAAALLDRDRERAARVYSRGQTMHALSPFLEEVVRPALDRVGEAWRQDAVDVADEHFATAFIENQLHSLLASHPSSSDPDVIVTTLPDERHELGALSLVLVLRSHGLDAAFLGADTPLSDLAGFVDDQGVEAVAISAPRREPVTALEAGALADIAPAVFVGGAAAEADADLVEDRGAIPVEADLSGVARRIARRLS